MVLALTGQASDILPRILLFKDETLYLHDVSQHFHIVLALLFSTPIEIREKLIHTRLFGGDNRT